MASYSVTFTFTKSVIVQQHRLLCLLITIYTVGLQWLSIEIPFIQTFNQLLPLTGSYISVVKIRRYLKRPTEDAKSSVRITAPSQPRECSEKCIIAWSVSGCFPERSELFLSTPKRFLFNNHSFVCIANPDTIMIQLPLVHKVDLYLKR